MSVLLSYNQLKFVTKYYTKEKSDFGSAVFNLMKNYDLFLSLLFHKYQIDNTKESQKIREPLLVFSALFDIDRLKKSIDHYNKESNSLLYSVNTWTMYEASKVMMKVASIIANTPRIYKEDATIHELLDGFDEAVKMDRNVACRNERLNIVDLGNLKLKNIQIVDERQNIRANCPFCSSLIKRNSSFITHVIKNHIDDKFDADNPIRYDTLFRFMTKCAIVFQLKGRSVNNYFNFCIRALNELRYKDFLQIPLSAIEKFLIKDKPSQDLFKRGWRLPGSFESSKK